MTSKPSRRQFLHQLATGVCLSPWLAGCSGHEQVHVHTQSRRQTPLGHNGASVVATLILEGGSIVTGERGAPRAEALAIAGNRVLAVGTRSQVDAYRGPRTRRLDLAGGVAVPGLTDAHAHLVGLGQSLEQVDLRGATSVAEVVARMQEHAKKLPPGVWLTGRGWDQNLWPGTAMPSHEPLTAAFPERTVWVRRIDGHAGWGNRKLIEAAGLTADTAAPEGGEIVRTKAGAPTGVLIDAAMDLVPVPEPTSDDLRRALDRAQQQLVRLGLVGLHDMGVSASVHGVYRELERERGLHVRVHGYADQDWFEQQLANRPLEPSVATARYRLKGVKLYVDGALGSRGAAMLADYHDRAGHRGLLQLSPEVLEKLCVQAVRQGYQVASHAIGDRGIRTLLAAYRQALAANPEASDARLRVEHAQIVAVEDIATFAELGLIASMQPTHATSDMPWVPDRIGPERLPGAYAWQRFLQAGVPLAFGSDFPVEHPEVTHGLHAAVTRQDATGKPANGWLADQKVSLDQALAGFTTGAAYAVHREGELGKLKPGYLADVSCFADDLWKLDPSQLRAAQTRATIVDGEVVWEG